MPDRKPSFSIRPPKIPEAAKAFTALGDAPGDTLLPAPEVAPATLKAVPALRKDEPVSHEIPGPQVAARVVGGERAQPEAMVAMAGRVEMPTETRSTQGRRGRREQPRVKGPPVVQKTFYLPPGLAKRLAVHCAEIGCEQTQIVVDALDRYFSGVVSE